MKSSSISISSPQGQSGRLKPHQIANLLIKKEIHDHKMIKNNLETSSFTPFVSTKIVFSYLWLHPSNDPKTYSTILHNEVKGCNVGAGLRINLCPRQRNVMVQNDQILGVVQQRQGERCACTQTYRGGERFFSLFCSIKNESHVTWKIFKHLSHF